MLQQANPVCDSMVNSQHKRRVAGIYSAIEGGIPQGMGCREPLRGAQAGHSENRRQRAIARGWRDTNVVAQGEPWVRPPTGNSQ